MKAKELRIFAITDIHHGIPFGTKHSDAALSVLGNFIKNANSSAPDLIVDLGDRINDLDHGTDLILMEEVAEKFKKLNSHREHLLGNHDVHFLSVTENETILNTNLKSRSLDLCGWHLIFWCPDTKYSTSEGFGEDKGSLEWLKADLSLNIKPCIIFCHVPQYVGDLKGNYWFENNPWAASLPYSESVLNVIQKDSTVKMTVGGHVHWPRVSTLHDVHHITLPSAIEGFFSNGKPCNAWSEIIVGEHISINIKGSKCWQWVLPIRETDAEWPVPRNSSRAL